MQMTFWKKLIAYLISIPARIKGVKFGRNSFIGPGYDLDPKMCGVILGEDVMIGRNAWLNIPRGYKGCIKIGDGTKIGRNAVISSAKKITIGKKCLLSYNISLFDHEHEFVKDISPVDSGLVKLGEVAIGDNCFIGAHSFILKGVSLGKNCVVGANSVVVNSFPDYSVIAGNPAKLIKNLKSEENLRQANGIDPSEMS